MNRISNVVLPIVLFVTVSFLCACVELKQAGRTVGHTSRDVAREIGHGSRDVVKEIGRGAKRVVASVAEAEDESEDEEP
ncbi:MAG: hypothetical protein O7E57_03360 [Gammaproteobacteria bacterium]|nr:hypothetical protein [Gammaproteobacteria bacterium]